MLYAENLTCPSLKKSILLLLWFQFTFLVTLHYVIAQSLALVPLYKGKRVPLSPNSGRGIKLLELGFKIVKNL